MANSNFVVQNGLTVGPLTIDATTGDVTTTGNLNVNGSGQINVTNIGVSSVAKNDTSISITDTGTGSNIRIIVDGIVEHTVDTNGVNLAAGNYYGIGGASVLNATTLGSSVVSSSLTSVGTLTSGTWNGTTIGTGYGGTGLTSFTNGGAVYATSTSALTTGTLPVASGGTGTTTSTGSGSVVLSAGPTFTGTVTTATVTATTLNAATIGNSGAVLFGTLNSSSASQPNVTTLAGLTSFGTAGVSTTAQGHFVIAGNLTVQGSETIISSQNLTVNDSIINLHTAANLAALTTDDGKDIGMKMHYYKGADNHAFVGWVNSSQFLEYFVAGNDNGNTFVGTAYGTIKGGELVAANTTASTSTTSGALRVSGGAGIAGAVYAGSIQNTPIGSTTASTGAFTTLSASTSLTAPSFTKSGSTGVGDIGQSNNTFATVYATTFSGVSTTAKYADLAENYQADAVYQPGQVLMFGGEKEVTLADAETTAVAGVVSTNPAHLMNGGLTGVNVAAIALQGRVPCNVIGPVKKGDLMVSAGFGFARTSKNPLIGQVIGKALNNFDGAKGQIEIVVGRV